MASTVKTCSVDSCNGDASRAAQGARGFCRAHYSRWRRYGDPIAGRASAGSSPKLCEVDGCNGEQRGGGYCNKHYLRFRRHGDPMVAKLENHGKSRTRLYNIWKGMRSRCGHKRGCNARDAKNYRDRGILVCGVWQSFTAFAEWANANGYAENLTIDRIDNDGDYEPGNCRWVTSGDNSRAAGRKLTLEDAREIRRLRAAGIAIDALAARYGIGRDYIRRVNAGRVWPEPVPAS